MRRFLSADALLYTYLPSDARAVRPRRGDDVRAERGLYDAFFSIGDEDPADLPTGLTRFSGPIGGVLISGLYITRPRSGKKWAIRNAKGHFP